MRHVIAALVAALFLAACGPSYHGIAPGATTVTSPYAWPPQGPPTGDLKTILDGLKTPQDISEHLLANYPWRDDYDTTRFLSPAELVEQKRGVCSAFARFWVFALARQGIPSHFIATWGPSSAHAFVVFKDGDHWKLASNQYLYKDSLGTERDQAIVAGNAEFYGMTWTETQLFDPDSGKVRQPFTNPLAPKTLLPLSVEVPGKSNLFSIKR